MPLQAHGEASLPPEVTATRRWVKHRIELILDMERGVKGVAEAEREFI